MREAIELIQRARREGRAALDEPAGKALLAAYGIAVPRSVLVHGAAEVTMVQRSPTTVVRWPSRPAL